MSDQEYCYPPDYTVLRNKLNLTDAAELDYFEREFVIHRATQDLPTGDFDLAHLRAIHRHLFQDVYDWAGEIRTVEIVKGETQFQVTRCIEMGIADVHRRIVKQDYLRELSSEEFAGRAAEIIGDINHAHPFREGNGRTQLFFYKLLGKRAGHDVDLKRLKHSEWMDASRAAHLGDYNPMARCLRATLTERDRTQTRDRTRRR